MTESRRLPLQERPRQFGHRALFLLLALLFAQAAGAEPSVRWINDADNPRLPRVEAALPDGRPVPEDLRKQQALLKVAVATTASNRSNPPMAGRYAVAENTLSFRPRFPLEPGLTYVATLDLGPEASNPPPATLTVAPPGQLPPPARVAAITPTAETLPFNLLKFYLHFSAPMTRGSAYRHIVLRNGDGTADPLTITFGEPLDAALVSRLIIVRDKSGAAVPGSLNLPNAERRWEFTPDRPWQDARYELVIDHRIEDLAGNSIERRFEEALDRHPDQAGAPVPHTVHPFTPGGK